MSFQQQVKSSRKINVKVLPKKHIFCPYEQRKKPDAFPDLLCRKVWVQKHCTHLWNNRHFKKKEKNLWVTSDSYISGICLGTLGKNFGAPGFKHLKTISKGSARKRCYERKALNCSGSRSPFFATNGRSLSSASKSRSLEITQWKLRSHSNKGRLNVSFAPKMV